VSFLRRRRWVGKRSSKMHLDEL